MQATMRKITALLEKDARDLCKNPTVLLCVVLPIGFLLLYTRLMGIDSADGELAGVITPFYLSCGLCFAAAISGAMAIIYAMAEEREKHTLRTLMLANVSAGQVVVSRVVLALVAVVAVDIVCFFLINGEKGTLGAYVAIGVLGSLPLIMLALLVGLASRDQMTAGLLGMPILIVAIAPMFSLYSEDIAQVVQWFPTGGMDTLVRLSAAGNLFTAEAVQPLLITLAWFVTALVIFALLFHRLSRDN